MELQKRLRARNTNDQCLDTAELGSETFYSTDYSLSSQAGNDLPSLKIGVDKQYMELSCISDGELSDVRRIINVVNEPRKNV